MKSERTIRKGERKDRWERGNQNIFLKMSARVRWKVNPSSGHDIIIINWCFCFNAFSAISQPFNGGILYIYLWILIYNPTAQPSPYDCDFESGICSYTQDKSDRFDWTRANGPTGSASTGPATDHTFNNGNPGNYIFNALFFWVFSFISSIDLSFWTVSLYLKKNSQPIMLLKIKIYLHNVMP